jgi:hypothetical protein
MRIKAPGKPFEVRVNRQCLAGLVLLALSGNTWPMACRTLPGVPAGKSWKYLILSHYVDIIPFQQPGPCPPPCGMSEVRELHSNEEHVSYVQRSKTRNGWVMIDSLWATVGSLTPRGNEIPTATESDPISAPPISSCDSDSLLDSSLAYAGDSLRVRFDPKSGKIKVIFSDQDGLLFYRYHYTDSSNYLEYRVGDSLFAAKIAYVQSHYQEPSAVRRNRAVLLPARARPIGGLEWNGDLFLPNGRISPPRNNPW